MALIRRRRPTIPPTMPPTIPPPLLMVSSRRGGAVLLPSRDPNGSTPFLLLVSPFPGSASASAPAFVLLLPWFPSTIVGSIWSAVESVFPETFLEATDVVVAGTAVVAVAIAVVRAVAIEMLAIVVLTAVVLETDVGMLLTGVVVLEIVVLDTDIAARDSAVSVLE